MTKNVLVLGAGMMAGPVVQNLSNDYKITVVDREPAGLDELQKKYQSKTQLRDAINGDDITDLIEETDLIISLLPASLEKDSKIIYPHAIIADRAVDLNKSVVTASYISKQMQSLHKKAQTKGVLLLNECGLDPGIDHMSAMELIDKIHSDSGKVLSFESHCGGLPSNPKNNPFGYQLSWSPEGVLNATKSSGRYYQNGTYVTIPSTKLFTDTFPVDLPNNPNNFEGYYNRDVEEFIHAYGLNNEVNRFVRGTLRYQGFCEILNAMNNLGMLSAENKIVNSTFVTALTDSVLDTPDVDLDTIARKNVSRYLGISESDRIIEALEWLGTFDDIKIPLKSHNNKKIESNFHAILYLMQERMQYESDQTDMVVMQHELEINYNNSEIPTHKIISTLEHHGNVNGYTAMAQTVGLTVAYSARLILENELNQVGVLRPTIKDIYNPVLTNLKHEGITFKEKTIKI